MWKKAVFFYLNLRTWNTFYCSFTFSSKSTSFHKRSAHHLIEVFFKISHIARTIHYSCISVLVTLINVYNNILYICTLNNTVWIYFCWVHNSNMTSMFCWCNIIYRYYVQWNYTFNVRPILNSYTCYSTTHTIFWTDADR